MAPPFKRTLTFARVQRANIVGPTGETISLVGNVCGAEITPDFTLLYDRVHPHSLKTRCVAIVPREFCVRFP